MEEPRNSVLWRFMALISVLALVAAACAPEEVVVDTTPPVTPEPEPTPALEPDPDEAAVGGILRIGDGQDNYTADPDNHIAYIGRFRPGPGIFEPLTRLEDDLVTAGPLLAESWEWDGATNTWTFIIRDGVTFHDGTPLTAEAAAKSLQRLTMAGAWSGFLGFQPDGVSAVDDRTLKIEMSRAETALPSLLTHTGTGIESPNADPYTEFVGTGPYMFVEYVPDQRFVVERNPGYWGDPNPTLNRVEFRFIPDDSARVLALQAGEVDVIVGRALPLELAESLVGREGIRLVTTESGATLYLGVALSGEPPYTTFQDVTLREAIGYALNREVLVDSYGGFARDDQTLFAPVMLGRFAAEIDGYTYDPERAKSLLEQAGWTDADGDGIRERDGERLTLELIVGLNGAAIYGQRGEIIQAQLREVGIDVTITPVPDGASYVEKLQGRQGDVFLELARGFLGSPCGTLGEIFLAEGGEEEEGEGEGEGGPNPFAAAYSPEIIGITTVTEATLECSAATDVDAVQAAAARAVKTIVDEARVFIPLLQVADVWAIREHVIFEPAAVEFSVNWTGVSLELE